MTRMMAEQDFEVEELDCDDSAGFESRRQDEDEEEFIERFSLSIGTRFEKLT